jgi:hypothetical protein
LASSFTLIEVRPVGTEDYGHLMLAIDRGILAVAFQHITPTIGASILVCLRLQPSFLLFIRSPFLLPKIPVWISLPFLSAIVVISSNVLLGSSAKTEP